VVLDLTQSLGALPFDLAAVDPDMVVAVGYKWMLGPYQVGYQYIAPRWQGALPIEHNWTNRAGADDFARLTERADNYQPGARRFDVGQRSNFHTLPAAIAATEIVADLMAAGLGDRLAALTAEVEARLAPLGYRAEPGRAPHYLALETPGDAPPDLVKRLAADQIYVSQRGRRIRITPHLNIRPHDLDRLEAALAKVSA
jgi:selenocysteine lyase/cysteine desulfurase